MKPETRDKEKQTQPRLRLRVSVRAESILRGGHPWLFSDSIRDQNRDGAVGELAVIYDHADKFLALGLFDPHSPIRVRVLHYGKPVTLDAEWWREHLRAALTRREGLFDTTTDGYRWINGESDGWPGLVLDRYASTLVLKLYTAAWLPRLGEIVAMIRDELNPEALVLRLSRNIRSIAKSDFNVGEGFQFTSPPPQETVVFTENGLRFEADVLRGQKTGFFLDQRDNRLKVESLAAGRDVLNAFSFSGGFSLYAARGGARSVTDLDLSAHALAGARSNFALNAADARIATVRHDQVQADAFEWLAHGPPGRFDLVILDPPSLAKRESERAGAITAYTNLAASGIARLRPGGILVAASCSAHVTATEFFSAVRHAARQSGRSFDELWTTSHPPDHPATIPEAEYLKCICLGFD